MSDERKRLVYRCDGCGDISEPEKVTDEDGVAIACESCDTCSWSPCGLADADEIARLRASLTSQTEALEREELRMGHQRINECGVSFTYGCGCVTNGASRVLCAEHALRKATEEQAQAAGRKVEPCYGQCGIAALQAEIERLKVDVLIARGEKSLAIAHMRSVQRDEACGDLALSALHARIEGVRQLVETWRGAARRHKTHGDSYRVGQGWGMDACADELESALVAPRAGQPLP